MAVRSEMLDPDDDAAFTDWYGAIAATDEDLFPGEPGWQPAELRASLRDERGPERTIGMTARDTRGRVVGSGWIELPVFDNRHLAMLAPHVPPEHRRRGVGTTLLEAMERVAIDQGRTVLAGFQDEPLRMLDRSPGRSFATACGYAVAIANARRDLSVPVPEERLATLEAVARARSTGYRALTWDGPWPDEYLQDRLELGRRMSTDAPIEDFEVSEEHWDEARVRGLEELLASMDRTKLTAVVLHEASGRLVAFSEIAIPRAAPTHAYQHDTLVLSEHRGHRIGLLVKLANLRALADASPDTRVVTTHNALSNSFMIAVNDALGCRVTAHALTWQKKPVSPRGTARPSPASPVRSPPG